MKITYLKQNSSLFPSHKPVWVLICGWFSPIWFRKPSFRLPFLSFAIS